MALVKVIRVLDGSSYSTENNSVEMEHAINEEGTYIGLVEKGTGFKRIGKPPKIPELYKWDFTTNAWTKIKELEAARRETLDRIDILAGNTRRKFITDVPGQQAVYLIKLEQAKNFIASGGTPEPYLAAEARVTKTNASAAATQIVNTSNMWNDIIGPQIEEIRRANKILATSAVSITELNNILAAATSELAGV